MHIDRGQVVELILENGLRHARISCPANLTPSPGQYLLAGIASQSDLLPVPLFPTESTPEGFIACAPLPESWTPGTEIILRGPLGHGFELPASARKAALVPFDVPSSRLRSLIQPALNQGAAVVLVCDSEEEHLPDDVEVQPLSALDEVLNWADYVALEILREGLPVLREKLVKLSQAPLGKEAQILIRTSIPCGGVAECGVCAVSLQSTWKMACKDGPVFDLREI